MTREDAVTYIKEQDPQAFLSKARRRGFVCPKCGNGTGSDGDGIIKDRRTGRYKCFRCNEVSGDIFDLIGATYGLSDFNDQFERAVEIYGITVDKGQMKGYQKPTKTSNITPSSSKTTDLSGYINACHERAGQTDYFSKRGITKEIIDKFNLGYDPEYKTANESGHVTWQAIIIPTSNESYNARNINVEPNSSTNGKNKYRKKGSARPFNLVALTEEKEQPIVLCEGEIDAMSIIAVGGQAIGLGSTSSVDRFLREIDKIMPSKPFIVLLDPDDAGKAASDKLVNAFEEKKIPYLAMPEILDRYHDPNDRLLNDPEGLKDALKNAIEKISQLPDPADEAREDYLRTSAGYSIGALRELIAESAKRPRYSTGFKNIDEALDGGIYTGLYIIGAISSLGKTTLTLQIADNLAKQGRDVLFFTLEQSKNELISKSVSRETYLYCKQEKINTAKARSNLDIMDGRRWDNYDAETKRVVESAFERYEKYAKHVFIYEGIGNIAVEEIREKVKKHISITGNSRPIVFIDYLQILKAAPGDERSTDKQIVDHNITALKQLSRDLDIPILAVSSLNRENYTAKISMTAFKESGAIEYGSDVLIGLQLHGAGEKNFDLDEEKEKDPRELDFCILKYRNGKTCMKGIPLRYKPMFNCFEDSDNPETGWIPVSGEDEDNLPFD